MAIGNILETFDPRNLGDVMTIGETTNPTRIEYTAVSYGKLNIGTYILKDNFKANCQIMNFSFTP